MSIAQGAPVFVTSSHFPESRPGIVVGTNEDGTANVYVHGTGQYHIHKGLKHRKDGDDYGILEPGEKPPKSAGEVAREKAIETEKANQAAAAEKAAEEKANADAPSEQPEGSETYPDLEGTRSGLVSEEPVSLEETEADRESEPA